MSSEAYQPTTPADYERLLGILGPIFNALARLTVHGLENVPAAGPLLLTVNHLSMFDVPALGLAVPRRIVMFVTSKHKRNPVISAVVRMSGCIWVERSGADRAALKAAHDVLKAGMVVGIAPEGTRSRTHALQPGHLGAAYIATRANVPILPVTVAGVEQIRHRMWRGQRTNVSLVCGPPYCLPDDRRAKGDTLEAYATEIMCRLAAQLPESYRGVYAGHPRVKELVATRAAKASSEGVLPVGHSS